MASTLVRQSSKVRSKPSWSRPVFTLSSERLHTLLTPLTKWAIFRRQDWSPRLTFLFISYLSVYFLIAFVDDTIILPVQVLTAIGNFCICSIAVGMFIEIIVMYPIQHRAYRPGIDNLLVLLIGGIPIAMPTVLSVTMAIGSHRLSQQVFTCNTSIVWFQLFYLY